MAKKLSEELYVQADKRTPGINLGEIRRIAGLVEELENQLEHNKKTEIRVIGLDYRRVPRLLHLRVFNDLTDEDEEWCAYPREEDDYWNIKHALDQKEKELKSLWKLLESVGFDGETTESDVKKQIDYLRKCEDDYGDLEAQIKDIEKLPEEWRNKVSKLSKSGNIDDSGKYWILECANELDIKIKKLKL